MRQNEFAHQCVEVLVVRIKSRVQVIEIKIFELVISLRAITRRRFGKSSNRIEQNLLRGMSANCFESIHRISPKHSVRIGIELVMPAIIHCSFIPPYGVQTSLRRGQVRDVLVAFLDGFACTIGLKYGI